MIIAKILRISAEVAEVVRNTHGWLGLNRNERLVEEVLTRYSHTMSHTPKNFRALGYVKFGD